MYEVLTSCLVAITHAVTRCVACNECCSNATLFIQCIVHIEISQCRLLFGSSLLYTDRVPFELLGSAALL
jgi:hypothetical protein